MKHNPQHEIQNVTFLKSATKILNSFLYITSPHLILTILISPSPTAEKPTEAVSTIQLIRYCAHITATNSVNLLT